MAIDFPSSPSNGQIYTDGSGYSFTYYSTPGVWRSAGPIASDLQYTWSNTQTFTNTITFNSVLNVGSNNYINTTAIFLGNSTVNTRSTSVSASWANSTTTSTINTAGYYTNTGSYNVGSIGTANGVSLSTAALNIGNSTVQTTIASNRIAVGPTATPYLISNSTYSVYSNYGLPSRLAGEFSAGSLSADSSMSSYSSYIYVHNVISGSLSYITTINGALFLTSSSTANNDIDISPYLFTSSSSLNFIKVRVAGQYIANTNASQNTSGAATLNQSHLYKAWEQMAWANVAGTFALEGGTVYNTYNGDATNFPAGAINAAKVLLVAGTAGSGQLFLRLIQRTTPGAQSATRYNYMIEVLKL